MSTNDSRRIAGISPAAAVLWGSAMILAALVIMQAGRLPINAAYAETAMTGGNFSLLTVSTGQGQASMPNQVLYVIDSRDQVLLVYEIENLQQNRIILRDGAGLDTMFRNAAR
jgi:hypothetical protein